MSTRIGPYAIDGGKVWRMLERSELILRTDQFRRGDLPWQFCDGLHDKVQGKQYDGTTYRRPVAPSEELAQEMVVFLHVGDHRQNGHATYKHPVTGDWGTREEALAWVRELIGLTPEENDPELAAIAAKPVEQVELELTKMGIDVPGAKARLMKVVEDSYERAKAKLVEGNCQGALDGSDLNSMFTAEEQAAMKCLKPGFIDGLIEKARATPMTEEQSEAQLHGILASGSNRGERQCVPKSHSKSEDKRLATLGVEFESFMERQMREAGEKWLASGPAECPSCGVAWESHPGVEQLCQQLADERAEGERLKEELRVRDQWTEAAKSYLGGTGSLPCRIERMHRRIKGLIGQCRMWKAEAGRLHERNAEDLKKHIDSCRSYYQRAESAEQQLAAAQAEVAGLRAKYSKLCRQYSEHLRRCGAIDEPQPAE